MRSVSIHRAMNGFIVDVGCQRLVFNSSRTLIAELERYLDNPLDVEKEYLHRYGMESPGVPVQTPQPFPEEARNILTPTMSGGAQAAPSRY